MKNADRPAHPLPIVADKDGFIHDTGDKDSTRIGLTKREMFAMAAMQTIITIKGETTYNLARNHEDVCGDIALAAIRVADETLKQLEL